jgi:hypothetical protein
VSAIARRLLIVLSVVAVALSVGACETDHQLSHPTAVDGEQEYVDAGPVTYQVQITRQLNPWAVEDSQYLAGLPGTTTIAPDQLWYGVFLWAKNQTKSVQTTTDNFTITDSANDTYYPVTLPPTNGYAWTSAQLAPGTTEPAPETTAANGPTQGGAIIFKLPDTVYSNRPLTLNIYAPGQSKPSTVSLDL